MQNSDTNSTSGDTDAVWRALANPTRRGILDLLRAGPLNTGAFSEHFPELSRFAVMQHLGVLEEADLIVRVKEGRQRLNYLNPVPIQQLYDRWVSDYMQPWTTALTGLKHELEAQSNRTA